MTIRTMIVPSPGLSPHQRTPGHRQQAEKPVSSGSCPTHAPGTLPRLRREEGPASELRSTAPPCSRVCLSVLGLPPAQSPHLQVLHHERGASSRDVENLHGPRCPHQASAPEGLQAGHLPLEHLPGLCPNKALSFDRGLWVRASLVLSAPPEVTLTLDSSTSECLQWATWAGGGEGRTRD